MSSPSPAATNAVPSVSSAIPPDPFTVNPESMYNTEPVHRSTLLSPSDDKWDPTVAANPLSSIGMPAGQFIFAGKVITLKSCSTTPLQNFN
jgi:hypothetical protein